MLSSTVCPPSLWKSFIGFPSKVPHRPSVWPWSEPGALTVRLIPQPATSARTNAPDKNVIWTKKKDLYLLMQLYYLEHVLVIIFSQTLQYNHKCILIYTQYHSQWLCGLGRTQRYGFHSLAGFRSSQRGVALSLPPVRYTCHKRQHNHHPWPQSHRHTRWDRRSCRHIPTVGHAPQTAEQCSCTAQRCLSGNYHTSCEQTNNCMWFSRAILYWKVFTGNSTAKHGFIISTCIIWLHCDMELLPSIKCDDVGVCKSVTVSRWNVLY